jgi:hypothetical protein
MNAHFSPTGPKRGRAKYACPRCRRSNEYAIRFVRRVKKDRLPQGADERDRAKFAKLRDHLLRLDDEVTCKTCGQEIRDSVAALSAVRRSNRRPAERRRRAGRRTGGACCAISGRSRRATCERGVGAG